MSDDCEPRIRRGRPNSRYTAISNSLIDHPTLSPDARLVLIYLLSKPEDWQLQPGDIRRLLGTGQTWCGRNKAYEVLKELKEAHYVRAVREVDELGHFEGVTCYVYDEPFSAPTGGSGPMPTRPEKRPPRRRKIGEASPCPRNRDTVTAPRPLFRDPGNGDITKDRNIQNTESPPSSPPPVSASLGAPNFVELWQDWPELMRPDERPVATRLFDQLSRFEQCSAVHLAKTFCTTRAKAGKGAFMIPYLRHKLFTEFVDAPPRTSDGYFRITPDRPEWAAWMNDLRSRISSARCDEQERRGYLLTRSRLPELSAQLEVQDSIRPARAGAENQPLISRPATRTIKMRGPQSHV